MADLHYYLYFLASDEEVVGSVWEKIQGLYNLSDRETDPEKAGASVSRFASAEGVFASLSVAGHIATFELIFKDASSGDMTALLGTAREAVEEELLDSIGESTLLIDPEGESKGEWTPLPDGLLPGGSFSVVPEKRGDPRRFFIKGTENGVLLDWIREKLVPLDRLTHEMARELGFDEDQHETVSGKMDEMNRQVGGILNEKSKKLSHLEEEVSAISDIHAQMTNYNSLLGNIAHRLRSEMPWFDRLHSRAFGVQDTFFQKGIRRRAERLLDSLSQTQKELSRSLENARAAVDVIKSRVDLNRSRTNLELQQQISSMMRQNIHIQEEMQVAGVAASLIEFFVVLYYGLGVWKTLAGEELMHNIPPALTGALISLFSLSVVIGTHKTAKALKEKSTRPVLLWGVIVLGMLGALVWVTGLYAH
ncbi:MAG: hypothetical protein JXR72_00710 [Proteobacteria bacterium]|nr:hypothetical protein [Pseudomonadota bacterium]